MTDINYGADHSARITPQTNRIPITNVRSGLVGEFLFHRNLLTSRWNSAGARANGAEFLVSGTSTPVTYGSYQMEAGAGGGIQTNVPAPSGAQTLVVVCSPGLVDSTTAPLSPFIAGGVGLRSSAGLNGIIASFPLADGTVQDLKLTGFPARPLNALRCYIVTVMGTAAGSAISLAEYMGGAKVQETTAALGKALAVVAASPIIIGSAPGDTGARSLQSIFLPYNRALTDAERTQVYLEARSFLAKRGKSI